MRKSSCFKLILALIALTIAFYLMFTPGISRADEVDDLQKQINDLTAAREQSVTTQKLKEGQLNSLKQQLTQVQQNIKTVSNNLDQKEKELKDREEKLSSQEALLHARVRSYYIQSFMTSPFLLFLSSQSPAGIFKDLAYRAAATKEDQRIIQDLTGEITDLTAQRDKLDSDKKRLASLQQQIDKNAVFINSEIQKQKSLQSNLASQIASLTKKQQQIIAERQAALNLPIVATSTQGACVDDRTVDPGFSPRFAAYSFGVMNHIGLNQYGAKGRAEAGQSGEQILSAYYDNYTLRKDYSTSINITVNGFNPDYNQTFNNEVFNIEDYVKHLYEMPASWSMEALKAQAVAARTYALAASNNGANPVCPSQSCQVIKHEINGTRWQQAVDETKGWVMVRNDNGQPFSAWFSSVHGGYVYKSSDIGWSATSWTKNGVDGTAAPSTLADLFNTSFDKSSPWFYCDWGSRPQYNKTAWLTSSEMADIVNVVLLAQLDSSTASHLYQLDKPNRESVDTWSPDRVKQELQSRGGAPLNSVSAITIGWDKNTGKTTAVYVNGDTGTQTIDGTNFKNYFNIRAPANLQIVSLLYNIEKK